MGIRLSLYISGAKYGECPVELRILRPEIPIPKVDGERLSDVVPDPRTNLKCEH